ncbi:unnamed protein product [Rhodiola kirilowii]
MNAVGEYQEYNNNQQEPTKSLDDTIKELAGSINQLGTSLHQHQEKTDGAISELTKQISQLAASVSTLTNESGRLLSQTIQMQEDVNALTLRSGKTLVGKPLEQEDKDPRLPGKEQMRPESLEALEEEAADEDDGMYEEEQDVTEEEGDTSKEHIPGPVPRTEDPRINAKLPFPVLARMQKQHVMDEDVFELFSKVEINIPLLEAIKQIPRYAKFLKELCINRRKTRNDQELMSRNVSAAIQRKMPPQMWRSRHLHHSMHNWQHQDRELHARSWSINQCPPLLYLLMS